MGVITGPTFTLAAAALALGWLVVTHITNVATDAATKAVQSHEDGAR